MILSSPVEPSASMVDHADACCSTPSAIAHPPPPLPSDPASRAAPLRLLPPRPPLDLFRPLTAATGGGKSRHPYRRKRHCGRCRRSATAGRSRGDGGARRRRRGEGDGGATRLGRAGEEVATGAKEAATKSKAAGIARQRGLGAWSRRRRQRARGS